MLYIGTDDGIYRWITGAPWPVLHSLQGRSIVGLASPGGGVLAALDGAGRIWETMNNGLEWRSVPLPDGAGRPTSLALLGDAEVLAATARPMALLRRPIGLPPEVPTGALARARKLEERLVGRARAMMGRGGAATMERPAARLHGWTLMASPSAEAGAVPPSARLVTADGTTAFAALAGAGLWRSEDLGGSWSRVEGLPDDVYAIRFAAKKVVAGTSDGVWISDDGGASWRDSGGGLEKARQVRAVAVKPGDPKVMLAGAAPRGAGEGPVADRSGLRFALYETKDGGASWKHVTRGFPEVLESDSIADIRYMPDDPSCAAIALASGEMWSTATDGLWWEPLARQIRGARALCATG